MHHPFQVRLQSERKLHPPQVEARAGELAKRKKRWAKWPRLGRGAWREEGKGWRWERKEGER
jgi:hypothetical protein